MTEPLADAILRKLVPYLTLEGDEVHLYAYDAGSSVVLEIGEDERRHLLALGMEVDD